MEKANIKNIILLCILPSLILVISIYYLIWLGFQVFTKAFTIFIVCLLVILVQIFYSMPKKMRVFVCISKYVLFGSMILFFCCMHFILGPSDNIPTLYAIIITQFIFALLTIPLCIIEIKLTK